jgi:hypothetical protein
VQVTTDPKPWSLLVIPGAIAAVGGGLALDEQRRRREKYLSIALASREAADPRSP